MNLLTVIPLARGIFKETLTYFTKETPRVGQAVTVPIRGKKVIALVVKVEPVADLKQAIRSASFVTKKAGNTLPRTLFTESFIKSAEETAQYYAGGTGSIIRALVPEIILQSFKGLANSDRIIKSQDPELAGEYYILQADESERIGFYKSLIREEFAKKHSVYFALPTIADIEKFLPHLEKGIEPYTIALSSALSQKELQEKYTEAATKEGPLLIIATPHFLSIPRVDLGAIIIDRESSSAYRSNTRPYFDIRHFAAIYAKRSFSKLILGDILLRAELIAEKEAGKFIPIAPLKTRLQGNSKLMVVDMKPYKHKHRIDTLSKELREILTRNQASLGRTFIFASRRGVAPTTVCGDCGHEISCKECASPLVLHSGHLYICHKCGKTKDADMRCGVCASWKLVPLGIGIEQIESHIRELFPNLILMRLDSDAVTTHKKAREVIDLFYKTKGAVLLGTEMALAYLDEPVEATVVGHIDNLFTIPDFRIRERIFRLLISLRMKTEKYMLVQTRHPNEKVFEHLSRGTVSDFIREDLVERKKAFYPPFALYIKITREGEKDEVNSDMSSLEKALEEWSPTIYPAFIPRIKGRERMHLLLRLPRADWPHPKILAILSDLRPKFKIVVDPEELL